MTTIRISRLPEIRNDRVSEDDYLVINDGDITTSKISFKEFIFAVGAQDIEFTGDMLYTGDVVFEGAVTGDFYNKDQTYSKAEIDQLIKNLNDYNVLQDARITAIETLIGRPSMSTHLGMFTGGVIPDNATIVAALSAIEDWIAENRVRIEDLELDIIRIDQELDKINQEITNILEIINGDGNTGGPGPPGGILPDLEWLIDTVTDHELRILALEKLMGNCDISGLKTDSGTGEGSVTCALNDHEDRIVVEEDKSLVNDAENANLITLSGVTKSGGSVTLSTGATVPIVSDNLETFTYPVPPWPANNDTFTGNALNNKSVKEALQLTIDNVKTRSPIKDPIFTGRVIGAQQQSSAIPFYYEKDANLNGNTGDDGTLAALEGSFAYTRNSGTWTPGDDPIDPTKGPRAWVRGANQWIELLTTTSIPGFGELMNLVVAENDDAATIKGCDVGFIYIFYDPLFPDPPRLKVNGINPDPNANP